MTKFLLLLLVLITPAASAQVFAPAGKEGVHYFRFIDVKHPRTATQELFDIDLSLYGSLVDVALITHDTIDGTVIPTSMQKYLPPSAWVPFQVGAGGSLSGRLILHAGMSYNVGSLLATSVIGVAGMSSSPTGINIKKFFSEGLSIPGVGDAGFYAGVGIAGAIVQEGHFQGIQAMFPGQGIGPILNNAAKYSLGVTFKPK